MLSFQASAQHAYSCRVYYYDGKESNKKLLYTIQQFNKYGKIVSEESYANYFADDAPPTVDTCSATTHYFYQNDTLLARSVENIPGLNECTIKAFVYNSNGKLTSDTEWHSYNLHRIDHGLPDSIRTWTTTKVYTYEVGKRLIEETTYDDTLKASIEKYYYSLIGLLLKSESRTRRISRISGSIGEWELSHSFYKHDTDGRLAEKQTWGERRYAKAGQQKGERIMLMRADYTYAPDFYMEIETWPEGNFYFEKKITRKYTCKTGETIRDTEIRDYRFTNGLWTDQTSTKEHGFFPDKRVTSEINEPGGFNVIYEYY